MLIGIVARATAREAVRGKTFLMLIALFGLGVLLAPVVGWISATDGRIVTTDLIFSLLSITGVLVAVATGTALVHNETQQRTLYTVLSRPLPRTQFVLGKYLGLCAALVLGLGIMLAVAYLALWAYGYRPHALLLVAGLLVMQEACVMAAVSLAWTSLSSPLLAAALSLATWFLGHAVHELPHLMPHLKGTQFLIASGLASLVPDLGWFAYRNQAVYGVPPSMGHLWGVVYGLLWMILLVTCSVAIFRRKQL